MKLQALCIALLSGLALARPTIQVQIQPGLRCGGAGYAGSTVCTDGYECVYVDTNLSKCVPQGSIVARSSGLTSTGLPATTASSTTSDAGTTTCWDGGWGALPTPSPSESSTSWY